MTFTTLAFVPFFITVVFLYYLLPHKFRYLFIFAASCFFYRGFVPNYILVLLAVITVDFFFAQIVEKSKGKKRLMFFIGSLLANVGVLFTFKYFNFFNENIALLADFLNWNYSIASLELLLPIGLSFHIFQSLSYVIEVYRGKYKAEKNIGMYATYVLFFPQLVAGPIERPQRLLPQLKMEVKFRLSEIFLGLRIMAWGFFKKLVIADRLSVAVDYIYSDVGGASGLSLLIAMVFFAFQLYADFSGYSDIARGAARVLGIDVLRNFNGPYFARSITEFWRRWHISLSEWFRDYFYFPLARSVKTPSRTWLYTSIIITFLATGLWHGAGWTFLIMGLIHGSMIVFEATTKDLRERVVKLTFLALFPSVRALYQTVTTFLIASFSWIFFRSPDFETARLYVVNLFTNWDISRETFIAEYIVNPYNTLGITQIELFTSITVIIALLCVEYAQRHVPLGAYIHARPLFIKTFMYTTLILLILTLGVFGNQQFIYFQF